MSSEWVEDDLDRNLKNVNKNEKIEFNETKSSYEGETKLGRMNGLGKYNMPNGNVFEGNFLDGNFHGKGILFYSNGNYFDGMWKNGKMQSGKFYFRDGLSFEEKKWEYCTDKDRRLYEEILRDKKKVMRMKNETLNDGISPTFQLDPKVEESILEQKRTGLNLLDVDAGVANIMVLYFFSELIPLNDLESSLKLLVQHIPQLSSVIKKRPEKSKNKHAQLGLWNKKHAYFLENVQPSNVNIIVKTVSDKTYDLFKLRPKNSNDSQGHVEYKEGGELFKLCEKCIVSRDRDYLVEREAVMKVTYLKAKDKCILGVSMNHVLSDSHAFQKIMKCWSEIYEGVITNKRKFNSVREELETFELDRSILGKLGKSDIIVDDKTLIKMGMFHKQNKMQDAMAFSKTYTVLNLYFTEKQLQNIREKVEKENKDKMKVNDNNVIIAHLWKMFAIFRKCDDNTVMPVFYSTNLRGKVKGLSDNYLGNATILISKDKIKRDLLYCDFSDLVNEVKNLEDSLSQKDVEVMMKTYENKIPPPPLNFLYGVNVNDWRSFSNEKMFPKFGTKCVRCTYAPPPNLVAPNFFILMQCGLKEGGVMVVTPVLKDVYEKVKDVDLTAFGNYKELMEKLK